MDVLHLTMVADIKIGHATCFSTGLGYRECPGKKSVCPVVLTATPDNKWNC